MDIPLPLQSLGNKKDSQHLLPSPVALLLRSSLGHETKRVISWDARGPKRSTDTLLQGQSGNQAESRDTTFPTATCARIARDPSLNHQRWFGRPGDVRVTVNASTTTTLETDSTISVRSSTEMEMEHHKTFIAHRRDQPSVTLVGTGSSHSTPIRRLYAVRASVH